MVAAGARVPCEVQEAQDFDTRNDSDYSTRTSSRSFHADGPLSYQWSADKGHFEGSTTNRTATWIAPDDSREAVIAIVKCTIDDPDGPRVNAPETGSHDDDALVRTATLRVEPSKIDMDMDVDHTTPSGYPVKANGDRSDKEEKWEESSAVFVLANQGDHDGDYVPNYADGIDLYGNGQADSCGEFSPMVVELNVPVEQLPMAQLVFRYEASDPALVRREFDAAGDARYSLPDKNMIRIWKKDGPKVRNPRSLQNGGDFIQPGHPYSAQELGWTGAPLTFYVEVVDYTGASGARPMSVEFYSKGLTSGADPSVDTVKIESYFPRSGNFGGSSN